jgi:hypothetical protein
LYNILIELGIPMKLVSLVNIVCLNETYSKVRMSKYMSDNFAIQNGLNKEMFIATAIQVSFRVCH